MKKIGLLIWFLGGICGHFYFSDVGQIHPSMMDEGDGHQVSFPQQYAAKYDQFIYILFNLYLTK